MKNLSPSVVLLFALILASCVKDAPSGRASISGNWNIVSDSTYSSGIGPNSTPLGNKYTGIAGDHFVFTGNKLYVKEGTIKIDTATYTLSTDTLKLNYNYLHENGITMINANSSYVIAKLNNNELELNSFTISPGGIFKEYIILSR